MYGGKNMKRLKILFYLTMAFLLTVNVSLINKRVHAQDRLPGYSEWSTEKTGEEGEISASLYGYKEATGFSDQGSETMPEDGFYSTSTKWKMTQFLNTVCAWRSIYGADSGISCWEEGAGWTTYRYNGTNVTYGDENTCSGVCKAEQITTYYPVTSWSEEKGWRMDSPYEKTNTINPVQATVYSHPVTYTINFDDGQVVKIKHGHTLPSVSVPSKTGYIFKGFFDQDGRQFYDAKGYTSVVYEEGMATSLYARWEPITYTVNYLDGVTASQTLKYDEYTNVKSSGYTKSGYVFSYWQDDYGKMYVPGDTIVNLTSTNNGVVNLHAVWKKNDEVIVTPTKKDETSDSSSTKKKTVVDTVVNKSDLDSENYYLIRVPQELIIDNNINTISFEVKGKLKDGSSLKIELPNTLYLKTDELIDYEMKLNNLDTIKGTDLSDTFKEIDISLNKPFDNNDKYNVSFPLTIQVISK